MAAAGIPTASSRTFADLAAALATSIAMTSRWWSRRRGWPRAREPWSAPPGGGGRGGAGHAGRAGLRRRGRDRGHRGVPRGRGGLGPGGHRRARHRAAARRPGSQAAAGGRRGPNTGGMGAYSPVAVATPAVLDRARREVLEPTLEELHAGARPFAGVLYAGLMVDPAGTPWVVEFNCRLGDPETQVVLPLVSGGLTDALWSVAHGEAPRRSPARRRGLGDHGAGVAGLSRPAREGRRDRIPADVPDRGDRLSCRHRAGRRRRPPRERRPGAQRDRGRPRASRRPSG